MGRGEITGLVVALCVVAGLGAAPHVRFASATGASWYFKSAFDEDTYANEAVFGRAHLPLYRLLSTRALVTLYEAAGRSIERALVIADVVFPALAVVTAWVLATRLVASAVLRLSVTFGLLFAQELLSLGCLAVWPVGMPWTTLAFFRSVLPPWSERVIPDYTTSYLTLYRTPEPQVSWIVLFVFLGCALVLARTPSPGPFRAAPWLALAVNLLLPFCYVFVAVAIVVLEAVCALGLGLLGARRHGAVFGGLGVVGAAGLAGVSMLGRTADERSGFGLVFPSRLPVVTPAVLLAVVGLGLAGGLVYRRAVDRPLFVFGAACLCVPLLLTNQQLVTGLMISARDWERNVNYPLLVTGWLALAGSTGWTGHVQGWPGRLASVVALLVVVAVLARAQDRVFGFFRADNEYSVAAWQALDAARPRLEGAPLVVLDRPELAPLVALRAGRPMSFAIDYTDVVFHPVPPLGVSAGDGWRRSPHRERLFEYFARLGVEPTGVAAVLRREAAARSGYYLAFLFGHADWWYPATDDRAARPAEILAAIPGIIRAYEEYLSTPHASWQRPAIILTGKLRSPVAGSIWAEELVGWSPARGPAQTAVYAYEQRRGRERGS